MWTVELRVLPPTIEGEVGLISSRLNLIRISASQAGSYVCVASNPAGRSEVTYKLIIDIQDSPGGVGVGGNRSGEGLLVDRETIIGISIAMVVLLTLFVLCTVFRMKKHSRHRREYKLKDYTDGTTPLKDAADGEVVEGGLRDTGEDERDGEEGNYTRIYKDWSNSADRTLQTLLRDTGSVRMEAAIVVNAGEQTHNSEEEDVGGASCYVQNGTMPNVIYAKCDRKRGSRHNQPVPQTHLPQSLKYSIHQEKEEDEMLRKNLNTVEASNVNTGSLEWFETSEKETSVPSSSGASDESEYMDQLITLDPLSSGTNIGKDDTNQRDKDLISDVPSYSEHQRDGKRPPRTVSFSADTNKSNNKGQDDITIASVYATDITISSVYATDCLKPSSNNMIVTVNPVAEEASFSSTETLVIDDTISNSGGLLESFQAQQQQRERREQQQWEWKESQIQQRERQLRERQQLLQMQLPKSPNICVDYRSSNEACSVDVCAVPHPVMTSLVTGNTTSSMANKVHKPPPPYHLHARDNNGRPNGNGRTKQAMNPYDLPPRSSPRTVTPTAAAFTVTDYQRRRLPTIPGQSSATTSLRWDSSIGRIPTAAGRHTNTSNNCNSLGRVRGGINSSSSYSTCDDSISTDNRMPSVSSLKYSFPHLYQTRTSASNQQQQPPAYQNGTQSSHRPSERERQVAFPLELRDAASRSKGSNNDVSNQLDRDQPECSNTSKSKGIGGRPPFSGSIQVLPNVSSVGKPKEATPLKKRPTTTNSSLSHMSKRNQPSTCDKYPITLLSDILSSPFDGASGGDVNSRRDKRKTPPEWNSPSFSFDADNSGTAL